MASELAPDVGDGADGTRGVSAEEVTLEVERIDSGAGAGVAIEVEA